MALPPLAPPRTEHRPCPTQGSLGPGSNYFPYYLLTLILRFQDVFMLSIDSSLCLKCVPRLCWVNMWRLVVFYSLNMSCQNGQNFPYSNLNFSIWRYKWAFIISKNRLSSFKCENNLMSEICGLWNGTRWCCKKLLFFFILFAHVSAFRCNSL